MNKQKEEPCTRYRATYRNQKLYVIVGPKRIHLAMANQDHFKTLAGLSLVERLLNELLDEGRDLEELAGICFENSMRRDDLPRILNDAILFYVDREEKK